MGDKGGEGGRGGGCRNGRVKVSCVSCINLYAIDVRVLRCEVRMRRGRGGRKSGEGEGGWGRDVLHSGIKNFIGILCHSTFRLCPLHSYSIPSLILPSSHCQQSLTLPLTLRPSQAGGASWCGMHFKAVSPAGECHHHSGSPFNEPH